MGRADTPASSMQGLRQMGTEGGKWPTCSAVGLAARAHVQAQGGPEHPGSPSEREKAQQALRLDASRVGTVGTQAGNSVNKLLLNSRVQMNAAIKESTQLLRILQSLESLALKTAAP